MIRRRRLFEDARADRINRLAKGNYYKAQEDKRKAEEDLKVGYINSMRSILTKLYDLNNAVSIAAEKELITEKDVEKATEGSGLYCSIDFQGWDHPWLYISIPDADIGPLFPDFENGDYYWNTQEDDISFKEGVNNDKINSYNEQFVKCFPEIEKRIYKLIDDKLDALER